MMRILDLYLMCLANVPCNAIPVLKLIIPLFSMSKINVSFWFSTFGY